MKIKTQALLVTILAGSFILGSPRHCVAQADDQPAPQAQAVNAAATNAPSADDTTVESSQDKTTSRKGRHREAVVRIGGDAELKAGDTAEAVVAVRGLAISRGNVREAVVAVAGNVTVSG